MQQSFALSKCCQLPMDIAITKMFDTPECKNLEPTGEGKEMWKQQACHSKCVFKSKGIINGSGEIDKAKLIELTEIALKDYPEFKAPALASVEKCTESGKLSLKFFIEKFFTLSFQTIQLT